jgi:hypothetical protein
MVMIAKIIDVNITGFGECDRIIPKAD